MSAHDGNGTPLPESLWDANDVARFLKVSRSWVYQKAESGELPSLKIGGLLRFNPAVIRRWVLEPRRAATVVQWPGPR